MQTKKVLVIDDNKQVLKLLKLFVEKNKCSVATESSAEKGLARLRKQKFDMILLDIMLPDNDGLTVLKDIQKISPRASIVMITGGNDTDIAKECLRSGAVDYITKPFDFEYLQTCMQVNIHGF